MSEQDIPTRGIPGTYATDKEGLKAYLSANNQDVMKSMLLASLHGTPHGDYFPDVLPEGVPKDWQPYLILIKMPFAQFNALGEMLTDDPKKPDQHVLALNIANSENGLGFFVEGILFVSPEGMRRINEVARRN